MFLNQKKKNIMVAYRWSFEKTVKRELCVLYLKLYYSQENQTLQGNSSSHCAWVSFRRVPTLPSAELTFGLGSPHSLNTRGLRLTLNFFWQG